MLGRKPQVFRFVVASTIAVSVLLAACGGDDDEADKKDVGRDVTETTESNGAGFSAHPSNETNTAGMSKAATVKPELTEVAIYDSADATEPSQTLNNPDEYGTPITFLVDSNDTSGARLPVYLPLPPNGSKGWINASDVTTIDNPYAVKVELAAHKMTVTKAGENIVDTAVAVGRSGRETPLGLYFVTELREAPNPDGDYGPYAYGISGFGSADAAAEFGIAEVGIHGTNKPELIGTDVSSGCIRVPNDIITQMAGLLPLGTPVEIVA